MEETSEELPNFSIGIDLLGPDPTSNKNKAEKNSQVASFANLLIDQLQQILLLRADPCCRSVIEELAHAFRCAYIELWMHLRSLESTHKARVALGCASSYSYAFFVLSKLPACIHNSIIRTLSMNKFLISVRHCFFNFIYQEIVCKGFIEFLVVLATH